MSKLKSVFESIEELDPRSVSFLIKALEVNNIEGFDYLEFKQSVHNLAEIQLDDETAIKSAFATASTMGLDKKKLLDSGHFYQKVLGKEKEKFEHALQKQVEVQIHSKKEKIQKLKEQKSALTEKMQEIQAKIQQMDDIIEKATQEMSKSKEKIEESKLKFEEAYDKMHSNIQSDLKKFEKVL